ncbi:MULTISPECIES: hypothetical protein [unclassified Pseudomonas]|uniref:hypothetical protein n=1 Tax=unclassified Pseudomonas TaxID=196821 RepID=UPI001909F201|nr:MULTISPECIES: hypothetical protein [unclassified Pseudomonas]MBK3465866.1 hypothetical protein [Pseudomonas sp. MF6776]QXE08575.1 hypothetical protein GTQ41_05760 [Pseudomonas sp. AN-B15]
MKTIEYKVLPVTRHIVTMFVSETDDVVGDGPRGCGQSCAQIGEYPNGDQADLVADALVARDKANGIDSIRVRGGLSLGEVISGKRIK